MTLFSTSLLVVVSLDGVYRL